MTDLALSTFGRAQRHHSSFSETTKTIGDKQASRACAFGRAAMHKCCFVSFGLVLLSASAVLGAAVRSEPADPEPEPAVAGVEQSLVSLRRRLARNAAATAVASSSLASTSSAATLSDLTVGSRIKASPPNAHPELLPQFDRAKQLWEEGWPFHVYFFGVGFLLMAVLSLLCLGLMKADVLEPTPLSIPTLILLALLGACRGIFLLVDPYNAENIFDQYTFRILNGISMPILTSAYALVFAALVRVARAKSRIGPLKILAEPVRLYSVLFFGISFYVMTECLVVRFEETKVMVFICQSLFIAWGLFLFSGFLITGGKIIQRMESSGIRVSVGMKKSKDSNDFKKRNTAKRAVMHSVGTTAILGIVFLIVQIYSLVESATTSPSTSNADPWTWYWCNTCMRLVELGMLVSLFYTVVCGRNNRQVLKNIVHKHALRTRI